MSSEKRLAVVVLTWNGREDTLACLESLRRGEYILPSYGVFVMDNGSADGTAGAVRAAHPWARLIENQANLGFAGGNNAGIKAAMAEGYPYILVLNNDTQVQPGSLEALLAFMDHTPGAGAAQPLLMRMGEEGVADSLGQGLLARLGAVDEGFGRPVEPATLSDREIFGACAAAALYRTRALEETGLFNEDLFVLLEDVDLSFRLRALGWSAWLVPSAVILHRRGVSQSSVRSRFAKRQGHVNRVYLSLCYWPLGHLVAFGPELAYSAVRGLLFCQDKADRRKALALWRQALSHRRRLGRESGIRATQRTWIPPVRTGLFRRRAC